MGGTFDDQGGYTYVGPEGYMLVGWDGYYSLERKWERKLLQSLKIIG